MTDPAIARSLEPERLGYRREGEVTGYVGRRDWSLSEDTRATALGTLAATLEKAEGSVAPGV